MLISVIVPIYKVEKYLPRCVESILAQTHKELEIILVDDGSPDNCGNICDGYAKRDSRVRVIHKVNGGLSDARNAGLAVCSGDYIGFVDSDDYIAPDMYESLAAFAEKEDLDVAMCGVIDVWLDREEKTETFAPFVLTDTDEILAEFLAPRKRGTAVPVWNRIYRASIFKDLYFEKGRYYEDGFYLLPWIERTRRFGRLSDVKYFYIHREGAITDIASHGKRIDDFREAYENLLAQICLRHPRSVSAAECRLWTTYRTILLMLEGRDAVYCRSLAALIRRDMGRIWRNPRVSLKAKVGYSFMAADVDVYFRVRRMYRKLKGKK